MQTRDRLVLALDVDDLVEASALAKRLQPWFATAKVGLELFSAAGPDAVGAVADLGYDVFLDLKLHDIPTTVRKAARVIGALGRQLPHAARPVGPGDAAGRRRGAGRGRRARPGCPHPSPSAVTVLTSDGDAPAHILGHRVAAAVEAGCGGMVLAAADVREAKQLAPRMLASCPASACRRRRPTTRPGRRRRADAVGLGADLLVIGRTRHRRRDDPGGGRGGRARGIAGQQRAA